MNWQEVTKTYPLSWKSFRQYVYHKLGTFDEVRFGSSVLIFSEHDEIGGEEESFNVDARSLYDFFDAEEIIIELGVDWNCLGYIYRISQSKWVQSCSTRAEAEEQAFLRAFEILEQKLKEGR